MEEPEEGKPSSWATPSTDEIAAADSRVGDEEKDGPAETGTPEETPAPKADEPAEEAGGAPPEEAPSKFVVNGKEYTAEQIADLEKGALRQDDYTQKTMLLADQRRAAETERAAAEEERKFYYEERRRAEQAREREGTDEELEPLDPQTRKEFDARDQKIEELETREKQRLEQAEQTRQDAMITETFDGTMNKLFEEFNVPAGQRKLYERAVIGSNPDPYDDGPGGKVLSESAIRNNTRAAFLDIHTQTETKERDIREETVQDLRDKTPRSDKPSGTPPPAKPAERPGRSTLLRGEQEGRARDWSSEDATKDILGRLAEMRAGSD